MGEHFNIGGGFRVMDAVSLTSSGTIYSKSVQMDFVKFMGLRIATVTSTVGAMKVSLQESNYPPATEGAADSNFVVPDGMDNSGIIYASLATSLVSHIQVFPVPASHARLRFSAVTASTPIAVTAEIWLQG